MEVSTMASYNWITAFLGTGALVIAWILFRVVADGIGASFAMFSDSGIMSAQTATVAYNMLWMLSAYIAILLVGYALYNPIAAANIQRGGGGGSHVFLNGAIIMLTAFLLAVILSFSFGTIVDSIEVKVLESDSPDG